VKSNLFKTTSLFCVVCICISFILFTSVARAEKEKRDMLIGKVIYIDAGHGGKDNGASFDGVLEDEINLKIAGYVIENLIELDTYVLMSRTSDYDLSNIYDKNKKRKDLANRVKRINDSKADLFVSIHLNAFSSESISGPQVFYKKDVNSKMLADSIQEQLNILNSNKKRKAKAGDYYILNKSERPGVIVECGFLSNDEERKKLASDYYQKNIAKKITTGIVEYFNHLGN
jgi:N-acetylmuramoyl-L-alanine amidase